MTQKYCLPKSGLIPRLQANSAQTPPARDVTLQPAQVLAIDPGTREMGIAILEGKNLIYRHVVNLKRYRPQGELVHATRMVLDRILQSYNIRIVVLEKVPHHVPVTFKLLVDQVRAIKAWATSHRLPLVEIAAQTVRKHLVSDGWATKREAAKIVVSRYPELKLLLSQDYRYKEKYWQNMFDAVALGITYQEQYAAPR